MASLARLCVGMPTGSPIRGDIEVDAWMRALALLAYYRLSRLLNKIDGDERLRAAEGFNYTISISRNDLFFSRARRARLRWILLWRSARAFTATSSGRERLGQIGTLSFGFCNYTLCGLFAAAARLGIYCRVNYFSTAGMGILYFARCGASGMGCKRAVVRIVWRGLVYRYTW